MELISRENPERGSGRNTGGLLAPERNISGDEFMAASIGDVVWLDQTMKEGHASGLDRNGLAPIHLAALHGRLNCLQLLIEKYDENVNLKSSAGWTAIHLCINKEIGSKALKCVNYLLSQGADIDQYNDDNVSPIHQAASEGLFECLKVLVCDADMEMLTRKDCRGYTPLDLARIWGHKNCARMLKNVIWKCKKERKAKEMEQLKIVKQIFKDLQQDAIHQLRNEQDFYGGVAFGNWLAEKGLPDDLRSLAMSHIERYPDTPIEGLLKRLRTSGGLEDCAQRLEKGTAKQQNRRMLGNQTVSRSNVSPKVNAEKSGTITHKNRAKSIKKVKVTGFSSDSSESDDAYEIYSHMSGTKTFTTKFYSKTPWNYSTNVNSEPTTDIKRKDVVSMSIHPDESIDLLPQSANLSVRFTTTPETKIRFTVPGGQIKSAGIRMPKLPKKLVSDYLSGVASERIKIPQEFKAVHVYDLQKKKLGEKPDEEAGMHLQMFGHEKFLRKSTMLGPSFPIDFISGSESDILPPLTTKVGHTRLLETLKGMNPPKTFLA